METTFVVPQYVEQSLIALINELNIKLKMCIRELDRENLHAGAFQRDKTFCGCLALIRSAERPGNAEVK